MQEILDIIKLIDDSIKEDGENTITTWNIIKDGYDSEVDNIRWIINNSKDWLANYQAKLVNDTGIQNLKIKYTWVMWYFIEIPISQKSKIPDYFIHRQALVSAVRFTTEELKRFETNILEWESKLAEREYKIFSEIREKVMNSFKEIKLLSQKTAKLDMFSSLASIAYKNNYHKPKIKENYDIEIIAGRHPIVEKIESDFISNNLELNSKEYIDIITWPNMGWKSTYLRQNALIILMAHIGSFVPAKEAKVPLTDRLFSRVWASDNLFLGQSTFMVEMQEVVNIMNNATKNSFIIIDEVGRGTSTYDGMSIAWSILKYIHDQIWAKTLFATHYHELIDESDKLKWVKCYSVAVWENNEGIVFLRKIIKWWLKKSYWLEVAKLAGMNSQILKEAKNMLKILENSHNKSNTIQLSINDFLEPSEKIVYKISPLEEEIKNINLNNMTPLDALNMVNKWKKNIN